MQTQPSVVRVLVKRAVNRYIDEAIRARALVSASACAEEILRTYPACQMEKRTLTDAVIRAAARAGVPVEVGAATDHAPRAA